MTQAGLYATRNNLSQIIHKVMHGEEHVILKGKVPIAKIIPVIENVVIHSRELISRIQAIRSKVKGAAIDEISAWKKEGRL